MTSHPSRQGARRVVASFPTYAEAQAAVDRLSDERFPVDRVSIVGQDLRFVEQVTGRFGYGRAALQGLASGAAIGALIGFLFGLLALFDPLASALALALAGLLIGAAVGVVLGLIGHALTRGRRDFSSVSGMQAGRYDILADDAVAEDAIAALSGP